MLCGRPQNTVLTYYNIVPGIKLLEITLFELDNSVKIRDAELILAPLEMSLNCSSDGDTISKLGFLT